MIPDIEDGFYKEAWEDADHPMACVNIDNTFIRVNSSFERMIGYSSPELIGKSWTALTADEYVGGDLKSIEMVISGEIDSYRLEKDYIHKRGHRVPVTLIVRRYPRSSVGELAMFRVEAPVATPTREELNRQLHTVEEHAREAIEALKSRIYKIEERGTINVNTHTNTGQQVTTGGDYTGRDKTTNSDKTIKWMMGAVVGMVIVVAWLGYYVATMNNNSTPVPPNINMPSMSETEQ